MCISWQLAATENLQFNKFLISYGIVNIENLFINN